LQSGNFPTVFYAEMHHDLEVAFLSHPSPVVFNAAKHPILVDDKLHTFDDASATSACAQRRRTLAFTRTRTDCISFSCILPAFRSTSCTIHSGLDQSFPHPIQRRFVGLGLSLSVFCRLFLWGFLFCRVFKRHFFFRRRTLLYRFRLFLF